MSSYRSNILSTWAQWRSRRSVQITLMCVLSALVGFTLQITKLAALDSSGRQYGQGSYSGKVSFLAVFGLSKALANLSVGVLVLRLGYTRTQLAGWVLGLAIPALAAGAGSGGSGWAAIMAANVALGIQQGLCWSVTVLAMLLLLPRSRRGLAAGLNETLGYTAVAAAAPVYGALETWLVSCSWAVPTPDLSPACYASASVSLTHAASTPGLNTTGFPSSLAPLPPLPPDTCATPDSWTQECLGECTCTGYGTMLASVLSVLVPAGLLTTALLMADPRDAHDGDDGYGTGIGSGGDCERDGDANGGGGGRGRDPEQLRLLEAGGATDGHGGDGLGGGGSEGLPLSKSAAFTFAVDAGQGQRPASGPGGGSSGGLAGRARGGAAVGAGAVEAGWRGLWWAFVQCSVRDPSLSAMNLAGCVSNLLTSLAWGLLLAWARDALRVPGPGRNLMAACYSFLKGLVQLLSGMLSDVAGRRWLVVSGLALNAAGLMTAAFGAGFGGALLGPDVRQAGADSVTGLIVRYGYLVLSSCLMGTGGGLMYPVMAAAVADHAKSTQSQTQRGGGNRGGDGYAGGSAGVVVRGGEQGRVSLEVAMATYRFWRDLGYAVGAVGGPIADVLGVEVAALVFAGVCGVVAAVVMVRYEERGHVEEGEEGVGVRVGRELG